MDEDLRKMIDEFKKINGKSSFFEGLELVEKSSALLKRIQNPEDRAIAMEAAARYFQAGVAWAECSASISEAQLHVLERDYPCATVFLTVLNQVVAKKVKEGS